MDKKVGALALMACVLAACVLAACGGGGGGDTPDTGGPGGGGGDGGSVSAVSVSPSDVGILSGSSFALSATTTGLQAPAYAWERSDDDGATWSSIAGAAAPTFAIEQANLSWAAAKLRVRATAGSGVAVSAPVRVDIRPEVRILHGATGGEGYSDGSPDRVRYMYPHAVAANGKGELFVADSWNQLIRKVALDGSVSTIAGTLRTYGGSDGPARSATFNFPQSIAVDPTGVLYVGDNFAVRRIDLDGRVTTLAGSTTRGMVDGTGPAARFSQITGLLVDRDGSVIVLDGGESQTLRRVTSSGVVTTVAGMAGVTGTADGTGAEARFSSLAGVIADPGGWLLVADGGSLRKVDAAGRVTLFAGDPQARGRIDGPRLAARFPGPVAMAYHADGTLYLLDSNYSGQLRRISTLGEVTTLAGGTGTGCGDVLDGRGSAARLAYAGAFAPLPDGRTFAFADRSLSILRTVDIDGEVRTVSGALPPRCDQSVVGGLLPTRSAPSLLASDSAGQLYLPDGDGGLRILAPDGTVSVPTWAHDALLNARGIAVDAAGNLYFTTGYHEVWKLDRQGQRTRLAGTGMSGFADGPAATAQFSFPVGVAVDAQGGVIVADGQNCVLRRISPEGMVSTLAGSPGVCNHADGIGSAARFARPEALAIDRQGRIVIADVWGHTIRRLGVDGRVETLAGRGYSPGLSNGRGDLARFNYPSAVAVDVDGYIYVADLENSAIRRITPQGWVSTVIGTPGVSVLVPGVGGTINRPMAIAVTPRGRVAFTSEWAVVSD